MTMAPDQTLLREPELNHESAPDLDPWPLTIVTWNIHSAVGTDGRFMPARVAEVLREIDADIIALQEVPLGGGGMPNVLKLLAQTSGFHAVEGITQYGPGRRFGNAVLSRYPIMAKRAIDLSHGRREPRGAVDADVDCKGHPLRIIATHLGLLPSERRSQVRRLLQVFDTDRMPVILMGDLNEWFVWGRALRWLVSHFEAVPALATFPSRLPLLSLDRIWIRPRHRLVHVEVHKTPLSRVASDHLPLIARIDG